MTTPPFEIEPLSQLPEAEREELQREDPFYWARAVDFARQEAEAANDHEITLDFISTFEHQGRRLRIREQLFIAHLLRNKMMDPVKALRDAGLGRNGDDKTARIQAGMMLNNPVVDAALQHALRRRILRLHINADRVLEELAKLSYANLTDTLEWDEEGRVKLRDRDDIPEHALHALAEISQTVNTKTGDVTTKVRMTDKLNAVTAMMKHLGLLNQKVELDVNVSASDAMVKARERVINSYREKPPLLGVIDEDDGDAT